MRFVGTFDYTMDERGRLPLPPMYRDAFREGIVLSQGHPDRCLRVHTRVDFERLAQEFAGDSMLSQRGRNLRRAFAASARDVVLDNQNRILVPASLRQFAGIEKQVLVIGNWECLEIWDPSRWEAVSEQLSANLVDSMEAAAERRDRA